MNSPLHESLGRFGSEIDFALIRAACDESVAESDRLDFKSRLPLSGSEVSDEQLRAQRLELAKDLAAMANGRGGMIVYGVTEDGNNRAKDIEDVGDLSDGVIVKKIHQVGYNHVYPPVRVRCTPVGEGTERALVVEIDESDETPHLVQPRKGGGEGWLIAPYRSGSDTMNMVEKQLEQAYQARFGGRRRAAANLQELYEEMIDRHAGEDRRYASFAVAALPDRPVSIDWGHDPRHLTGQYVSTAAIRTQMFNRIFRLGLSELPRITEEIGSKSVRRGLRRWTFTSAHTVTSAGPEPAILVVELHDLGGVTLLWRSGDTCSRNANERSTSDSPLIGLQTGSSESRV